MGRSVIADIRNNAFPELTVEVGTYITWRNLDPYPHSAETLRTSPNYFSAGALLPGETSSPVYFGVAGTIEYVCRFHHDMAGKVVIVPPGHSHPGGGHPHGGHGAHGLKHFHGFVTGGRSAQRLYMTHTPVLADSRHHYQVILQGSIADSAHAAAYENLRASSYGDGKIQIFHDHLALPDLGSGKISVLPNSSFEYYPNDPEGVLGGMPVPGLPDEHVSVKIEKVIHFHTFDVDADYPESLTYVVYGDEHDVFMDHYIERAPSFHSVAKLAQRPEFYTPGLFGTAVKLSIPSKRIIDVSPKVLRRVAFVDNSFHVFWLPPTGVYPLPQDPLKRRDGSAPAYECVTANGGNGTVEIGRFLHFDVRLLNYGVLIT